MDNIKYYVSSLDTFDIVMGIGLITASSSAVFMVFARILSVF